MTPPNGMPRGRPKQTTWNLPTIVQARINELCGDDGALADCIKTHIDHGLNDAQRSQMVQVAELVVPKAISRGRKTRYLSITERACHHLGPELDFTHFGSEHFAGLCTQPAYPVRMPSRDTPISVCIGVWQPTGAQWPKQCRQIMSRVLDEVLRKQFLKASERRQEIERRLPRLESDKPYGKVIPIPPMAKVKAREEGTPVAPTPGQLMRMGDLAANPDGELPPGVIIAWHVRVIAAYVIPQAIACGYRPKHLRQATWEGVDWARKVTAILYGTNAIKRAGTATVEATFQALQRLHAAHPSPTAKYRILYCPYAAEKGDYVPLSEDTLEDILRTYAELAGIPNFTPYFLRYAFATNKAAEFTPLKDIQNLMDHKNEEITIGYLRFSAEVAVDTGRRLAESMNLRALQGAAATPAVTPAHPIARLAELIRAVQNEVKSK